MCCCALHLYAPVMGYAPSALLGRHALVRHRLGHLPCKITLRLRRMPCGMHPLNCPKRLHAAPGTLSSSAAADTRVPRRAVGRRDLRKAELIQKLRGWLSPEGTEEAPVRRAALELGHLTIPQLKDWLRDRGVSVKGAPCLGLLNPGGLLNPVPLTWPCCKALDPGPPDHPAAQVWLRDRGVSVKGAPCLGLLNPGGLLNPVPLTWPCCKALDPGPPDHPAAQVWLRDRGVSVKGAPCLGLLNPGGLLNPVPLT